MRDHHSEGVASPAEASRAQDSPAPLAAQGRRAWIALGANLGDRLATLRAALDALDAHPHIRVIAASAAYETPPMYVLDQPPFLNACAALEVMLSPEALLAALMEVERQLGRRREVHRGPRTIDLDLLLMDGERRDTPLLTLPHPGIAERAFVLAPLCEIAPTLIHPLLHQRVDQLAAALDLSSAARGEALRSDLG